MSSKRNIKKVYHEIFKSYGHSTLEKYIQKIIELDNYLPYSSTFLIQKSKTLSKAMPREPLIRNVVFSVLDRSNMFLKSLNVLY